MKKNIIYSILLLVIILLLPNLQLLFAQTSNGIDVDLNVGECNNNSICEEGSEDFFTCPLDCTPIVVPPEAPHGGVSGSLVMDNVFNNLTVEVSYDSAIIKWQSSIPTLSIIKWGTNPDYKDGVLKNINYLVDHSVELTGLKDSTVYYFSIEAESLLRKTNSLENQVFQTLSLLDTTPPSNPTNVIATSVKSGVTVSWENPPEEDFDYIRVMKNLDRFYGSPSIGYLVYEGDGKYFTDSGVVDDHKYYYSLFSRDRAGNYSSGSLISIIYNPTNKDTWGTILTSDEKIETLKEEYIVIQGSSSYDFKIGSIFSLSGDQPINIKTNYIQKTKNDDMWVEIRNIDRGIIWQYFFTRIKDKAGYLNANIPSFEQSGYYNIIIHSYSGNISKIVNQGAFQINKVKSPTNNDYSWYIIWSIFIILLLLILLLFLILRVLPKLFKNLNH